MAEEKKKKEDTLAEILLHVQAELKAPKGQFNKFGKYNYRSCEDILEAVKPLLKEVGALLLITDAIELVGERYYVKARVDFCKVLDGETISVTALAREPLAKKGMDESQITGAASSYARKYALNGLFAIDDNKDSDKPNGNDKPADHFSEILDKAFFEFQKAHLVYLEAHSGARLSKDRFIKAIHKQFGALPTKVESIPQILKEISIKDVLKDEFDAAMAEGEKDGSSN